MLKDYLDCYTLYSNNLSRFGIEVRWQQYNNSFGLSQTCIFGRQMQPTNMICGSSDALKNECVRTHITLTNLKCNFTMQRQMRLRPLL